ncbi:MBL fold metallo-hydrolase [Virgibacillus ainsalahensis]
MLEKITENIHKLIVHLPGGMDEVNCYLIKGEKGYTVVDTGLYSKEAIDTWERVLASGIVVEKVVITHAHQDHIGLAKWFQQHVGVPVFISDLGYKEMKKFRESNVKEQLNSLVTKHGGPEIGEQMQDDSFIYDFEPDGFFEKNEEIHLGDEKYEAIWTPGHAPDQFCFYHKEKQLMIVGDHILKKISPVIGLWFGKEENPLHDYYESMTFIKRYPTAIGLPGHGEIIDNFHERVNETKIRHDKRLKEALESVKHAPKTVNQVCKETYGNLHDYLFLSQFMATLTRFIYLESLGKVEREKVNGVVTFKAKIAS